jgi:hypothetical protein
MDEVLAVELADILDFLCDIIMRPEVQFEGSTKKFKKDLKANLSDSRVVTAFGKLVTNKGIWVH